MKKTKKRTRIVLVILLLSFGFVKCSPPHFLMSGFDIHTSSTERALNAERSVWNYRPLSTDLIIKDSLLDVHFRVKEAGAYDNRRASVIYFQYYLPWVDVYSDTERKMFGVWFDYVNLYGLYDDYIGLKFDIKPDFKRIFSGGMMLEDDDMGYSYIGNNLNYPLPDTVRLVISRDPYLYIKRSDYLALSEKEQLDLPYSTKDTCIVLGEFVFVKADSIIVQQTKKHLGRHLFFKNVMDM